MSEQHDRILMEAGEKREDGERLLDEVRKFIARFCVLPDENYLDAITLWVAHTHIVPHFYTSPRLALVSPEPQAGKSRVLDILDLLVLDSMYIFNPTAATIFRTLHQTPTTLLLDEFDAVWNGGGNDESREDLRALFNAGYRRGATVPRCVGANYDVKHFNVYAAVALAGIGDPPDTIRSRSIIVPMRRRMRGEKVESFNIRRHEAEGHCIRDRLANWASDVGVDVGESLPEMPPGVEDRNEEIWAPLIAIADAADGTWPDRARSACEAIIRASIDTSVSLGIRLLADLRTIFGGHDRMSTAMIIDLLISNHSDLDDDAPWAELIAGKAINSRRLAELLKPYGVAPRKIKIDGISIRGYRREDLWDPWNRWLPPPERPELAEPAEPAGKITGKSNGATSENGVPGSMSVPPVCAPDTEPYVREDRQ